MDEVRYRTEEEKQGILALALRCDDITLLMREPIQQDDLYELRTRFIMEHKNGAS